MVGLLQGFGDRAGLAGPDDPEIDLSQANTFCCSAGDEDFIGNIQLITGNGLLDDPVSQVSSQCDD